MAVSKKNSSVAKELAQEFDVSGLLGNRHQETNPSRTRRAVEDLLEIKRYKELHDDYEEFA